MENLDVAPNYLRAANNHNVVNGESWLDGAGKFAAVSALSGVNSFYQTAQTVGGWFSKEPTKIRDTGAWIASLDSDLGKYYKENSEWADAAGFIGTSLVPGFVGMKGLKVLQTALTEGKIGANMSMATNLLVPRTANYLEAAAKEINASKAVVSSLNMNTAKALASGVHAQALEALAAETAIVATMGASPFLDNQDAFDIAKNMATGVVFGGAIGGGLEAIKTFSFLKKSKAAEDRVRNVFLKSEQPLDRLPASDRIIARMHDLEYGSAAPWAQSPSFALDKSLYLQRQSHVLNNVRGEIHELSGQNKVLGNLLADLSFPKQTREGFLEPGYAQNFFHQFNGADEVLLPQQQGRLEKAAKLAEKAGTPDLAEKYSYRYVKLHGEGVGEVTDTLPQPMRLADIYGTREKILREANNFGFSIKESAPYFDPIARLNDQDFFRMMDARYIWAKHVLPKIPSGALIYEHDIPLLTKAMASGSNDFKLVTKTPDGKIKIIDKPDSVEIKDALTRGKQAVASAVMEKHLFEVAGKGKGKSAKRKFSEADAMELASHAADAKPNFFDPNRNALDNSGMFARDEDRLLYQQQLKERGRTANLEDIEDPAFLPKYAKVSYRIPKQGALNQNMEDGLALIKAKEHLYTQDAKMAFSRVAGELADQFQDISERHLETANRNGGSAGAFSSANGNYGALGSAVQWIGAKTKDLKFSMRKGVQDAFTQSLYKVGNSLDSSIEFEALNRYATSHADDVVHMNSEAGHFLVPKSELRRIAGELEVKVSELDPLDVYRDAEDIFEIKNRDVGDLVQLHKQETAKRQEHFAQLNLVSGKPVIERDPEVFRPIRPNFRNYPYFSMVVNNAVTGNGQKTMLWAASEKELAQLEDKVRQLGPHFSIRNKASIEEYLKARGAYDMDEAMNSYELDSTLRREGIMTNHFPKSDPKKIVDEFLGQHMREADMLATYAVQTRYRPVFDRLSDYADSIDLTATSRFGASINRLKDTTDNPYTNYVKTALDIAKLPELELWNKAQSLADTAFSKVVHPIREAFSKTKSDKDLGMVEATLEKYGIKPAYYDAALHALTNHTAPKGELTRFVRGANSLLSMFTLGFDPMNALNNAIGSTILRSTETRHLVEAIRGGNSEIAGDLSKLGKIRVPGADTEILSPAKLQAQAYANFFRDMREGGALLRKYKDLGFVKDHLDQFKLLLDDITLDGTEGVDLLRTKMASAYKKTKDLAEVGAEKGQKWTGNKLSEEMNRFVSANVMDQLTSIAVKNGIMSEREALAYINTFVNRVDGVMLANQRPLIFQGPIGQAIGLFQSYQFNLVQQLLRYVGEGSKKDRAMLLGMQSTLYGFQSLPGFHFMNAHIIGTASGNTEHKDLYDAAYGIAGKELGDWFVYGAAANLTQSNIYNRGDLNPRQLTLIPTELMQVPAIGGWSKFFGNLKETSSKLMEGGAVWETVLQGIEHNGISRPLSGVAQVARGFTSGTSTVSATTTQGNILGSHDLWHLSSLARLAGGRPLDEAKVNDALFRWKAYEAADREKRNKLAEVVKTHLAGDGNIPEGEIISLAEKYAAAGGKQTGFNRWMMELYKGANTPQADQIANELGHPMAYKLQLLMGGERE